MPPHAPHNIRDDSMTFGEFCLLVGAIIGGLFMLFFGTLWCILCALGRRLRPIGRGIAYILWKRDPVVRP